jgi:gamma-glutamyl:cysteine ligase YbdK (ATP-grasp superfamily)
MGEEIGKTSFAPEDAAAFEKRLNLETKLLCESVGKGRFSDEGFTLGFEIESWLLDHNFFPSPVNDKFLAAFGNKDAVPELSKFNVELTCPPRKLEGDVFSQARDAFESVFQEANEAAHGLDADLVMIGTLPTIRETDLTLRNMSSLKRYYALNTEVLRQRGGVPLHIDIEGAEHLVMDHYDVMLEAGATSFQIHLKTPISKIQRFFNASVMASAPVLAASVNAPFLFGKNLWEETRIPLFEQAVDLKGTEAGLRRVTFGSAYAGEAMLNLLKENAENYPALLPCVFDSAPDNYRHVSLQNGTIWRWNRPLVGFEESGQPHLRFETRGFSAGPSFMDMMANAVLHIGLLFYMVEHDWDRAGVLSFEQARENFYAAARYGLSAKLHWPEKEMVEAGRLIERELIALAREGLALAHVSSAEADLFLGVVAARVDSGQTGAAWQRRQLVKCDGDYFQLMAAYCSNQRSGAPVHEWDS